MTAPATLAQASSAPTAEAVILATSTGAGHVVNLAGLSLAQVEDLLGGPLEVVQLDAVTCLLTNASAFAQHLPKNWAASQRWFARHPESGCGADYIRGEVILCHPSQIAHLDHLRAEAKPVLTARERAERAATQRSQVSEPSQEEARMACSLANPGSCEMCGA